MDTISAVIDVSLAFVRDAPPALSLLVLAISALLEYVAPPVPGDTFALVGGIVSGQGALSIVVVILVLTAGSIVGALMSYGMGRVAAEKPWARKILKRVLSDKRLDQLHRLFEKHGRLVVVLNRFIPGLRAYVIIGAGIGGMPARDIIIFGGISALAWNSALVVAGYAVGENLDLLFEWIRQYTTVAWGVLAFGAVAFLTRWLWRRRRTKTQGDDAPPSSE